MNMHKIRFRIIDKYNRILINHTQILPINKHIINYRYILLYSVLLFFFIYYFIISFFGFNKMLDEQL